MHIVRETRRSWEGEHSTNISADDGEREKIKQTEYAHRVVYAHLAPNPPVHTKYHTRSIAVHADADDVHKAAVC